MWDAIRDTLRQHAPELSSGMEGALQSGHMALRQVVGLAPNGAELQAKFEAVLARSAS